MRQRAICLALASAVLLWAAAAHAQSPGPRAEIAVREVALSDGIRRYVIPVTVGGTVLEAGLDTGSTGLRVLPGALRDADATSTTHSSTYAYGSGARLTGLVAEASLAIGTASGPATLELVRKVDCLADQPQCPASRVSLADYGIQGDGLKGEGFKAIIGVNMGRADVSNPFFAVGARRWIVELPLPDSGKVGRIILNPTAEETAGFATFRIDPAYRDMDGGMHDAIAGCLTEVAGKRSFCGPALMDTGDPGLTVINGSGAAFAEGAPAAIAFLDGRKMLTSAEFAVGRREFASRMSLIQKSGGGVRLHLGLTPYFAYSVLYDPDAGLIGLKPRTDSKLSVH